MKNYGNPGKPLHLDIEKYMHKGSTRNSIKKKSKNKKSKSMKIYVKNKNINTLKKTKNCK